MSQDLTVRRRRIDPRASLVVLILLNIQAAVSSSYPAELASVLLCALCMLWCNRGLSALRWLVAYALFTAAGRLLLEFGGTALAAFASMFFVYRRIFPIFMFASNLIATTKIGELACLFQMLRMPARLSVALCVALRFFPMVGVEFRTVSDAMRTRGISFSPVAVLRHPMRTLEQLMVPVVGRTGSIADELGDSVVVRGAQTNRRRTSYYLMRLTSADLMIMGIAVVIVVGSLVVKWSL